MAAGAKVKERRRATLWISPGIRRMGIVLVGDAPVGFTFPFRALHLVKTPGRPFESTSLFRPCPALPRFASKETAYQVRLTVQPNTKPTLSPSTASARPHTGNAVTMRSRPDE